MQTGDYHFVVVRKCGYKVYNHTKNKFVSALFIFLSEAQERADELNESGGIIMFNKAVFFLAAFHIASLGTLAYLVITGNPV